MEIRNYGPKRCSEYLKTVPIIISIRTAVAVFDLMGEDGEYLHICTECCKELVNKLKNLDIVD